MQLADILAKLATLAEDETSDIELSLDELQLLEDNFEQLDELSKETLKNYIDKAAQDISKTSYKDGKNKKATSLYNRFKGIGKAADKLTKRGLYAKTKEKIAAKKVDAVNESEASDTLVPGSQPGETRTSYIAALLAMTPFMSIDDLAKLYTDTLAMQSGNETSVKDNSAQNQASVAMKEDLKAIFASDDTLTEEFKTKVATLFEAAVSLKVTEKVTEIEEAFDDVYEETLEEEVNTISSGLVEKLDAYLDYAVSEYIKENEVAIESQIRSSIQEEFITDLRALFEKHDINIPETSVDVVEQQAKDIADLEEAVDQLLLKNNELKLFVEDSVKSTIVKEVSEGLTIVDAIKLETIAEDIEYSSFDDLKTKLTTIKENTFKKFSAPSNILTEQFDAPLNESEHRFVDKTVDMVSKALSRTTLS